MRYRYIYKYKSGLTRVKTKLAIAITTLALGVGGIVGSLAWFGAAHAAPATWLITAPNPITFGCGGSNYPHTLNTINESRATGDFVGTGYYNIDNSYTWNISGNTTGNNVTFTLIYTGTNLGYTLHGVGTIASDGSISGTVDNNCQTFSMPAGTAVQATDKTITNKLAYEFDNGAEWTLQKNTAAIHTTYTNPTYSDAGIIVDLGQAQNFTGLDWEGTDNTVVANIWLGDGSEAYTAGTHSLTSTVNFSYGPWNQTFWTGPEAGHPVTQAYIQGLGSEEVYAWIGVVYNGINNVNGHVSAVNGHSIGNRTFSFTKNENGTVTAVVH